MEAMTNLHPQSRQKITVAKGKLDYLILAQVIDQQEAQRIGDRLERQSLVAAVIDFRNVTHVDVDAAQKLEKVFVDAFQAKVNVIYTELSAELNQKLLDIFSLDKNGQSFNLNNADLAIDFAFRMITKVD